MYHIIINPASRSGKGRKLWEEKIEPLLQKEQVPYQAYFSEKPGDMERLAREIGAKCSLQSSEESFLQSPDGASGQVSAKMSDGASGQAPTRMSDGASGQAPQTVLILLGGDGTVNEALQGLTDPSGILLGYIPTGSSNDLARDLKIPKDPEAALRRILHPAKIHSMDLGIVTAPDGKSRRFAVSSGIGFDAAVCENVMTSPLKGFFNRLGLGKLTYLAVALQQLFAAKAVSCDLILDEHEPIHIRRILFVASMIHRFEGGGFRFCPDADDGDGVLNLCAVGDLPKPLILFALPTAFFGKHYLFPGVDAYSARKVRISTSLPLCVHMDGEILGHYSQLTIECREKALRII